MADPSPRETAEGLQTADELELLGLIQDRSFRRGRFKLSSGLESDLYFNLKPTMMHPRGAHLSARAFLARILKEEIDFVGGLEMGAVPIIASLAAISDEAGTPINTFFVRKTAKDYGTQDVIEGLAAAQSLSGHRIMIADDVATTGGSILKAVDVARDAGALVDVALVLVDRQEGAEAFLAEHGVRLISVFTASAFR